MRTRKTTQTLVLLLAIALASTMFIPPAHSADSAVMVEMDINHHPSAMFWGIPSDSVEGSPGWHVRAAIAHLLDKAEFIAMFTGLRVIENPVVPLTSPWYFEWTPDLRDSVDPLPGHTGAFGLYNDMEGTSDFCHARDHLVATGAFSDPDNNCIINDRPRDQIVIYARSDVARRAALGQYLESRIEAVFGGADVVGLVLTNFSGVSPIISREIPPSQWHMLTGSFVVPANPPTTYLCNLYNTSGDINYVYYSNPLYDEATTPCISYPGAQQAQFLIGSTLATIPVYERLF